MTRYTDEVHAAVAVLVAHGIDGPTFEALIRREAQASVEARPHDDEDSDREARFDAAALDVVSRCVAEVEDQRGDEDAERRADRRAEIAEAERSETVSRGESEGWSEYAFMNGEEHP